MIIDLTEKAAYDKVCPMSFNNSEGLQLCIGSTCMAWVWTHEQSEKNGFIVTKKTNVGMCGFIRNPT